MTRAWGPHAHPERCEEERTYLRHEDQWATWIAIGALALMLAVAVLWYEGALKAFWLWLGVGCVVGGWPCQR